MIRRLFARLIPGRTTRGPKIYRADAHAVRREQVPRGARAVTEKLQEAGYMAFVVGGAVRDLLLGLTPKDFDIATNATPEQVKPLFRRAFIIGRRFRLVHVHVGAEVLEVSTFRAAQTGEDATDEHGRLLSDNVYGSQAQDAARRDFTINALYFDPATEEIWDYVGGVPDVRARRLKLIGPPVTRFREDPVRMLRAVRLAAKVGVAIDAKTAAPIPKLAGLIQNVPPARLFDEMQKLLLSGHAAETLKSLRAHGLSHGLLPLLDVILEQPLGPKFIDAALAGTDRRVRDGKPVSPAFLFATLLWHEVLQTWNARQGPRRKAVAGAVRRDGQRAGAAGAANLDTAPLRGRDQGDLVAAAALRAARRRAPLPPARASALSRRLRLPRAARHFRRGADGARRLVDEVPGRERPRTRGDAEAGRGAEEGSPVARPRAQAPRRRHRRRETACRRTGRQRIGTGTLSRDVDRGVRRDGQQPRAPPTADCARRRGDRAHSADDAFSHCLPTTRRRLWPAPTTSPTT